jgi:excisionase family DNA binding protein
MTPPELATYLGIGRNTAYQLLNEGIIKGFRIGTQWKVSKEAVDYYIAKNSGMA